MLSLAQVKRAYDDFRRRYYSGFDMPRAEDLEWEWVEHPADLGTTIFLDNDPETREIIIQLHPILRRLPRLMWMILLHEMSHIAKPKADHGPAWDVEAWRLGRLGAMREFF